MSETETRTHRNKVAITAALAIALIALAGVGYAAATHQFNGTTASVEQTVDVDYVVVKLNEEAYTTGTDVASPVAHIWWNTSTAYDSEYTTTYTFADADSIDYVVTITDTLETGQTKKISATLASLPTTDGFKLQCAHGGGTAADVTSTTLFNNITLNSGTYTFTLSFVGDGTTTTAPLTSYTIPVITVTVDATQDC